MKEESATNVSAFLVLAFVAALIGGILSAIRSDPPALFALPVAAAVVWLIAAIIARSSPIAVLAIGADHITRSTLEICGRWGGLGVIATIVVALALGYYLRLELFCAVGIVIFCGWVAKRVIPARARPFLPAIALVGSEALVIFVGGLIMIYAGLPVGEGVLMALIDSIPIVLGLIWLTSKLTRGPVLVLITRQVLGLILNVVQVFNVSAAGYWESATNGRIYVSEIGGTLYRAVATVMLARLAGVVFMVMGLRQIRRVKRAAAEPDTAEQLPVMK